MGVVTKTKTFLFIFSRRQIGENIIDIYVNTYTKWFMISTWFIKNIIPLYFFIINSLLLFKISTMKDKIKNKMWLLINLDWLGRFVTYSARENISPLRNPSHLEHYKYKQKDAFGSQVTSK